jgi:hypothetical protein
VKRAVWASVLILGTLVLGASSASAGQFKRAVYYRVGQLPFEVITGQFTHSGNLDLAFANYLDDQLCILLGNGDGTFQKQRCFRAPAPGALASGDFNEDGNLDLAVVESGGTGNGALAIFLGDGNGGFKLAKSYPVGVASIAVAAGDFDGDGHLDVVVTNSGFQSPGSVMTFLGDGHGRLHKRTTYKLNGGPFGIAAQDLNGDNHPDLAVALNLTGSVAVFLNDGTGHFNKPVNYSVGGGSGALDVKIADLRNDGKQDLVIADDGEGMVVLLNKGDATFGKPTIYRPCGNNCQGPQACVVADFNLDGKLDVACAANIDDAYFFYGNGKGQFGTAIPINDSIKNQGGFSIAAGDFDNDKAPDLAIPIQNYGKVAVILNTK